MNFKVIDGWGKLPDGWHFVLMNTPGFGEDVE